MTIENSILKVVAYFDLFNYPLSKEEIKLFLDQSAPENDLARILQNLTENGCLYRHDEFYSFQDNPTLVETRLSGNNRAQPLLDIAYKLSKFLYNFPYVRGIGISGSLSKNFAAEKADIDFFIITKSNRLWIARTLMHLFKKLTFVVGRQHWFCMNYFVDETSLQIEEKNAFTAIELVTLIPVCGNGSLQKFFDANAWAQKYYPNHGWRTSFIKVKKHGALLKRIAEFIFDNRVGDRLDDYLLKLTSSRWNRKEARLVLNDKGNRMGLRNGKHFSKPNPIYFQDKILQSYMRRLKELHEKPMVAQTHEFR